MLGALLLIMVMCVLTIIMAVMTIHKTNQGHVIGATFGLLSSIIMVVAIVDCVRILNL